MFMFTVNGWVHVIYTFGTVQYVFVLHVFLLLNLFVITYDVIPHCCSYSLFVKLYTLNIYVVQLCQFMFCIDKPSCDTRLILHANIVGNFVS